MSDNYPSNLVFKNLDTTFVNLAALLHYLKQRDFVGRVHVEMNDYEADVFLNATRTMRASDMDHAAGLFGDGNEALQRLLARSTAAGGLISVHEGASELPEQVELVVPAAEPPPIEPAPDILEPTEAAEPDVEEAETTEEAEEWRNLVRLSGEIIAAVERVSQTANADFADLLYASRLELADDFPFLDPHSGRFEYSSATVSLFARPSAQSYVSAISECLRRVVGRFAIGENAGRIRERVALELSIIVRRKRDEVSRYRFLTELDRIAGTRVV